MAMGRSVRSQPNLAADKRHRPERRGPARQQSATKPHITAMEVMVRVPRADGRASSGRGVPEHGEAAKMVHVRGESTGRRSGAAMTDGDGTGDFPGTSRAQTGSDPEGPTSGAPNSRTITI